jgi:hypothetical protein
MIMMMMVVVYCTVLYCSARSWGILFFVVVAETTTL